MNEQSQMMNSHHQVLPPHMMQPSYGQWPHPPLPPGIMNGMNFANNLNPVFVSGSKMGRNNWKGKKPMDKPKNMSSRSMNASNVSNSVVFDVEQQNRGKVRRYYQPKRKFINRMGPYAHAPRNTTSFIIRAKKSGGIASLVSPCPVTPAVLPTPVFSPSKEAVVDMAKEEWGVDGYGSMKGLIRLRSPGSDEREDDYDEEDETGGCGSSDSDVEEHVEVERRLDHDLSRFEMIYPNAGGGVDHHNLLESRVDDQDTHIAQLEEENVMLKDRVYFMERELGDMRRRLSCLERQNQVVEDINEEVVENDSENYSDEIRNGPLLVNRENEEVDFVPRDEEKRDNNDETGIVMAVDNEVNHNDREASVVNNESEVIFKEDEIMVYKTQAEDTSNRLDNKVAGDVCMGDVVSTDNDLGDHKSDD
ncbi:uncharacterized protein LOC141619479 [Silene latifolia]|uniref:uncharacterized protein LOC141619479 n=1 Tax=Silene latifolia TaxID=37657 RepID=UPI003D7864B5